MAACYRTSRLADPAVIRAERAAGGWPSSRVLTFAEINDEHVIPRAPHPTEPEQAPTWGELVNLDPRLLDLTREALEANGSSPHYCANAQWYGYGRHRGLKPRLSLMVGWGRRSTHRSSYARRRRTTSPTRRSTRRCRLVGGAGVSDG